MDQPHNKPNIRHLVVSGGGETGMEFYGILRETFRQGLWDYNIETIHGTSVGSMIALSILFSKKLGWDSLDDYWYLRPWGTVFDFGIENIMNSFEKIGLLDIHTVEKMIGPCLCACDFSLDITLQEFYDEIGIELHVYSTNLDKMELIDISHKTHPTWKLVEAIYCSSALPMLFSPYKKDGLTYLDGAVMGNYPLLQCIENGANPDEILGIQKIMCNNVSQESRPELDFGNITDYLFTILAKLLEKVSLECPLIPYQIDVYSEFTNLYNIYKISHEYETRKGAIDKGIILGREYVEKLREMPDSQDNNGVDFPEETIVDSEVESSTESSSNT
jgi:predicted acylesterase/phospholipase RssA